MKLRAPVHDDAVAVHATIAARDMVDLGSPQFSLADLRDEWRAGDFDLAADARVAEGGGEILAYAEVRSPGAFAVVPPANEGRGIGAQLLDWVEERERQRGGEHHRQWINGSNARAHALLRGAGYQHARSYFRMVRSLQSNIATGKGPGGFAMRPVDVLRDATEVHAVDSASFAGAPDYRPESLEHFVQEHLGAHDFDPALSTVVEHKGGLVAFLLTRRRVHDRVGFVDILAVHPEHQSRGLGSWLLREAFARFATAGLREAQLGVASDNPRARTLYARAGMRPRFRFDVFERPIGGGG